jgi:hypothetical protein
LILEALTKGAEFEDWTYYLFLQTGIILPNT